MLAGEQTSAAQAAPGQPSAFIMVQAKSFLKLALLQESDIPDTWTYFMHSAAWGLVLNFIQEEKGLGIPSVPCLTALEKE